MLQNIALSFQGLWSHKLRSFLTMLGIIIGIASIITIVSTIKGTNEQIKENLIGSGNNVVTVRLSQDGNPLEFAYTAIPEGVRPADEEVRAAIDELPGVRETSFYRQRSYTGNVYWKNNVFSGELYGVDRHFFPVNGYQVRLGRGFTEKDFLEYRKVAILDARAASRLLEGENPVGAILEIGDEPYTVIGVVERDTASSPTIETMEDYYLYADTSAGAVFVPENAWNVLYRYDEPWNVAVRAESTDDMARAGRAAAELLNEKTVSGGKAAYEAVNLLERASELEQLTGSANTQLIWIAGISLLVGGIGVMNIMMVSVTERTREIGLKKAL
ncbi:MAG: ABC transporter permease, partial [Clostridia bacterium]|nr:ABC transporter permease [Clostridia bacterium]